MAGTAGAGDGTATRRDFLYITAGASGVVGMVAMAWPFVDQMNPSQDVLALSSIELDISAIEEGQMIKVLWRKKPVFIWHRSQAQIDKARSEDIDKLPDPEKDEDRVQKAKWLILVGVCTHLGCIPIDHKGDYGGFFCPCHGSHYDLSGRIRRGPAPENLKVPPYVFLDDNVVRIG